MADPVLKVLLTFPLKYQWNEMSENN